MADRATEFLRLDFYDCQVLRHLILVQEIREITASPTKLFAAHIRLIVVKGTWDRKDLRDNPGISWFRQ